MPQAEQKWPQWLWIVRHGQSAGNVARDQAECSPYVRAQDTAQRLLIAAGIGKAEVRFICDERLREKEFGILDRLTVLGIAQKYPERAEQRRHVGKFYFRPPGGESWCDVILRLRSAIEMVTREFRRERVLVVAHQVTVNCMRYLIERKSEADILAIDREADVPNCGVTAYEYVPEPAPNGELVARRVNFVSQLQKAGAPVTAEPDVPAAPKP